ncbi:MAG: efflux RND transporter periplasmic adaptor subunit [Legionella sp.]
MKNRMTIMMVALSIIFGGVIGFNLFKSFMIKRFFANYHPPAVSVTAVTASQQTWHPRLAAVGNFSALNGVDLSAQVPGNIVNLYFHSGQYVEQGAPLVDIDDTVEQATLKSNQSELALQNLNYKRQLDLSKRGATASSNVDEARAKQAQAQANVDKTEALIRQKHITAPFAGQLGIRQVNLGQYMNPGQTSIVSLQSLDPLYLNFYMPEQMRKQLQVNQDIRFTVEQNPNLVFNGKITAINSKVDTNTHNIQVQATVPNCPSEALKDPVHSSLLTIKKDSAERKTLVYCNSAQNTKHNIHDFNFIPGMFASIEIEQESLPNVVVLPTTAISYSLYGNSVFVIHKQGQKNPDGKEILTVKRVFVSIGDQQGNYTVIKHGVKPGDLIVAAGELKLQDDTQVVISNHEQFNYATNPMKLSD